MNEESRVIREEELHAYADDALPPDERAFVAAWLADHPDDAALVAGWMEQNRKIRTVFEADFQSRPTDREMLNSGRGSIFLRNRWASVAAAALLFASGVISGSLATSLTAGDETVAASLPGEARSAFLIYASEVRHPVEVGADEEDHLAQWLGKRLDYPLTVPDLSAFGFALVGGRLIPVDGRPGALFMYQNAGGQRLTVMLGRNEKNHDTSFRYSSAGSIETFYWIDGPVGYAVTGEISREELQRIAEECYRQFDT
ncbi:MAG: anti-sigma factor [Shinella sp.]|nr:anti-sigma factor [Shinella sp.]